MRRIVAREVRVIVGPDHVPRVAVRRSCRPRSRRAARYGSRHRRRARGRRPTGPGRSRGSGSAGHRRGSCSPRRARTLRARPRQTSSDAQTRLIPHTRSRAHSAGTAARRSAMPPPPQPAPARTPRRTNSPSARRRSRSPPAAPFIRAASTASAAPSSSSAPPSHAASISSAVHAQCLQAPTDPLVPHRSIRAGPRRSAPRNRRRPHSPARLNQTTAASIVASPAPARCESPAHLGDRLIPPLELPQAQPERPLELLPLLILDRPAPAAACPGRGVLDRSGRPSRRPQRLAPEPTSRPHPTAAPASPPPPRRSA